MMIYVDETEPVGDTDTDFEHRKVVIKRNRDVRSRFDLLHEIGRGKFGRVMKCVDVESGRSYAAKFIRITSREERRNVEREVDIMNYLNFSKLLRLYDAYDDGRTEMCILTEYIGGGELFDRVIEDEFVLTEKACMMFMKQIFQGVEYIHDQQILHLDLKMVSFNVTIWPTRGPYILFNSTILQFDNKLHRTLFMMPENILCLTKTGNRIKIIDFGLARRNEPMKKMQVLFGTPEFVAPEVVNFEPIGYATDMWAVGVICYVLLSGLSPFMGDTDLETMANVTVAEYDYEDEVFDDVSDNAKDLIDHLLVKEKNKRFSAKGCLEHPWFSSSTSTELCSTKENISSLQKEGIKPNYYIFDHSNKTITPSDESPLEAETCTRKRSSETEVVEVAKRCKTPTEEDGQNDEKCDDREKESIYYDMSCQKSGNSPVSTIPTSPALLPSLIFSQPAPIVTCNKNNDSAVVERINVSSLSEPSVNTEEIDCLKSDRDATTIMSGCNVTDIASNTTSPFKGSLVSESSSNEEKHSSGPPEDKIFNELRDIVQSIQTMDKSSQVEQSMTKLSSTNLNDNGQRTRVTEKPQKGEVNKVNFSQSRGRSRRENSVVQAKKRFEDLATTSTSTSPISPLPAQYKSPFTSLMHHNRQDELLSPCSPNERSVRRRSPSPVVTGAVIRARGRFEATPEPVKTCLRTNNNNNNSLSISKNRFSSGSKTFSSNSLIPTPATSENPIFNSASILTKTLYRKGPSKMKGPFGYSNL